MSDATGLIAVIDVETTGLLPRRGDRVIEIAAVVMRLNGQVEREFCSLVNPVRDIGPSHIHGLCAEDVISAPQFDEIAPEFVDALRGSVAVAGHNVSFDLRFLESEFHRIGQELPDMATLCTMRLAGGGKLGNCCRDHGICVEEGHHALADARASARLLSSLIADDQEAIEALTALPPIQWPTLLSTGHPPVTREDAGRRRMQRPSYLQRLFDRVDGSTASTEADEAMLQYLAILDRVLEDRVIEEGEVDALIDVAEMYGLTGDQVRAAHADYLAMLVRAALADGVVTEAERIDLCRVLQLLGFSESQLDEMLRDASSNEGGFCENADLQTSFDKVHSGMRVCFTGEMTCCYQGRLLTREYARQLATGAGLVITESLTKKVDLLVVADPHTQSGKARKARSYGTRILHATAFWKSIGIEVE
jgi:DNA polymerase-3 subunit epsilon